MREQINNNPVVQIGLVAILALAALMMVMRAGGSDGGAPADVVAPPDPALIGGAEEPSTSPLPTEDAPPTPQPTTAALKPSKGMPKQVVRAYRNGKIVALFFFDKHSQDDKALKSIVTDELGSRGRVALLVREAKAVSRFSQITQGVGLSRTPALIVMKPKSRVDNTPVASISYGFRGGKSVRQTIEDALYDGRFRPAHP